MSFYVSKVNHDSFVKNIEKLIEDEVFNLKAKYYSKIFSKSAPNWKKEEINKELIDILEKCLESLKEHNKDGFLQSWKEYKIAISKSEQAINIFSKFLTKDYSFTNRMKKLIHPYYTKKELEIIKEELRNLKIDYYNNFKGDDLVWQERKQLIDAFETVFNDLENKKIFVEFLKNATKLFSEHKANKFETINPEQETKKLLTDALKRFENNCFKLSPVTKFFSNILPSKKWLFVEKIEKLAGEASFLKDAIDFDQSEGKRSEGYTIYSFK